MVGLRGENNNLTLDSVLAAACWTCKEWVHSFFLSLFCSGFLLILLPSHDLASLKANVQLYLGVDAINFFVYKQEELYCVISWWQCRNVAARLGIKLEFICFIYRCPSCSFFYYFLLFFHIFHIILCTRFEKWLWSDIIVFWLLVYTAYFCHRNILNMSNHLHHHHDHVYFFHFISYIRNSWA